MTGGTVGWAVGIVMIAQGVGNVASGLRADDYNVVKDISVSTYSSMGGSTQTGEMLYYSTELITAVFTFSQGATQCDKVVFTGQRTVRATVTTMHLQYGGGLYATYGSVVTRSMTVSSTVRLWAIGQGTNDVYQMYRTYNFQPQHPND